MVEWKINKTEWRLVMTVREIGHKLTNSLCAVDEIYSSLLTQNPFQLVVQLGQMHRNA